MTEETRDLIGWLTKRAEREQLNILSHKLSFFGYIFASDEKRSKSVQAADKCLGKIEMIHEIVNEILKREETKI